MLRKLTAETRPFVRDHAYGQKPADAHTIVWCRPFEEGLQRSKAKGLPDELCKSSVGTIRQCIDDAQEREEVRLRICDAEVSQCLLAVLGS